MLPDREPEPRVTYAVRELLDRIDNKLDELTRKLDDRVTLEVFRGLGKDLQVLAARVGILEDAEQDRATAEHAREKYATGLWLWVRRGFAFGGWLAALAITIIDMLGVFK